MRWRLPAASRKVVSDCASPRGQPGRTAFIMLSSARTKDHELSGAIPRLSRATRLCRAIARWPLIALFFVAGTQAAGAPTQFDIRSAYVEPVEGVYQLNATLEF